MRGKKSVPPYPHQQQSLRVLKSKGRGEASSHPFPEKAACLSLRRLKTIYLQSRANLWS